MSLPTRLGWALLLIGGLVLPACVPIQLAPVAAAPLVVVTPNPNATPTATPFQPAYLMPALAAPAEKTATVPDLPGSDPALLTPTITSTLPPQLDPAVTPTPIAVQDDRELVTFLLLGSDTRGGPSFRTDTMVVAMVRPKTGEVSLLSLPRDLWVFIPGNDYDRLNTAYLKGQMEGWSGGGPGLLKDTIAYNFGIPIDYTAMVDFNGFRQIVDTLGGVEVPIGCAYTDWRLLDPSYDPEDENNWYLYTAGPGVLHMDGDLALWYARSRKRSSDFDRGRRQQEVLRAIYQKGLQGDVLKEVPELYTDFSSTVTTDLGLTDLLKLAPLALHLSNADIRGYYINGENGAVTSWITPGGAQVLLPNATVIQGIVQEAMTSHPKPPPEKVVSIEVRNGSPYDGWDQLAAQRLNYAGFETALKPADDRNQASTFLYDLTTGQDPSVSASILAGLDLPRSALISAPQPEAGVSYVLLVGADYQPCFDPNDLSH
jgi:polyisoprenyl-teichoic acid--peptidoglycan teichoic acid transferase